jgi:integrase
MDAVPSTPATSAKYKKRKRPFVSYTIYAFSMEEIDRLLVSCVNTADHLLILLGYRYGFRREDIVKLKWANLDMDRFTLTYHEQKKNRDRTIPIEQDVMAELIRYKSSITKRPYIFPFQDGSSAWLHLQDICHAAGIQVPQGRTGRPFHSLRGTCVKYRQSLGWNVNQCAALLGDEPETIIKHYATVNNNELSELMGIKT